MQVVDGHDADVLGAVDDADRGVAGAQHVVPDQVVEGHVGRHRGDVGPDRRGQRQPEAPFEVTHPTGLLIGGDRCASHHQLRHRRREQAGHDEAGSAGRLGHEHDRRQGGAVPGAEERRHPDHREQGRRRLAEGTPTSWPVSVATVQSLSGWGRPVR